jgi:hypothetical protein
MAVRCIENGVGKREFMTAMKAQLDAFPDYSENPMEITEDGDVVRFVAHVRGTQREALTLPGMASIAPTGKEIKLPPEPAWVKVSEDRLLLYHVEAMPGGGIQGILNQLGVRS